MLIKRVYEVDPLCCPECGGQMQVESFIEPPQADVNRRNSQALRFVAVLVTEGTTKGG